MPRAVRPRTLISIASDYWWLALAIPLLILLRSPRITIVDGSRMMPVETYSQMLQAAAVDTSVSPKPSRTDPRMWESPTKTTHSVPPLSFPSPRNAIERETFLKFVSSEGTRRRRRVINILHTLTDLPADDFERMRREQLLHLVQWSLLHGGEAVELATKALRGGAEVATKKKKKKKKKEKKQKKQKKTKTPWKEKTKKKKKKKKKKKRQQAGFSDDQTQRLASTSSSPRAPPTGEASAKCSSATEDSITLLLTVTESYLPFFHNWWLHVSALHLPNPIVVLAEDSAAFTALQALQNASQLPPPLLGAGEKVATMEITLGSES